MLSTTADHSDFAIPARARGHAATVSATRLKRPGQRGAPAAGIRGYLARYPGRSVIWGGFALCALGIAVNAMWLQTGQRLSPAAQMAAATLAAQPPLPPVRPPQQELVRQVQTTPAQAVAAVAQPAAQPATTTGSAARQPQASTPVVTQAVQRRDEIGDLLKAQETGAISSRTTSDGRSPAVTGDSRQVANAQRALAKLGYTTARVDGRLGEETRAAIERFERDRKLTITRDVSPRTMRELAAVAGVRFE